MVTGTLAPSPKITSGLIKDEQYHNIYSEKNLKIIIGIIFCTIYNFLDHKLL